jgi:pimeloyl-ACP methyl ester carboxylesterase
MHLVLLHALARSPATMRSLARALEADGHEATILPYPSRVLPLDGLAEHVLEAIERRGLSRAGESLGFVGHSMGGVVYRAIARVEPTFRCGRSVLLGSPTMGSKVASVLAGIAPVRWAYGTALPELVPTSVQALPAFPGPTACIAGTRAFPLVPAYWVLRAIGELEPSDSTVLVREALHPEAAAHATIAAAHTFLPSHPEAHALTRRFLKAGNFGEGAPARR